MSKPFYSIISKTGFLLLAMIFSCNLSFGQTPGLTPKLDLNLNSGAVYGNNCGIAESQPVLRVSIEKLIKAKDLVSINEWLRSGSEVRQVYGAEALIRLENEGLDLTFEQLEIIEALKHSPTKINTCYGCIYGPQEIQEIMVRFKLKHH